MTTLFVFKVFTENFYKVQVTQIYNLFLLLSAQTCYQTQNAGNATSETQELKNFRGHIPAIPLSTILDPPLAVPKKGGTVPSAGRVIPETL